MNKILLIFSMVIGMQGMMDNDAKDVIEQLQEAKEAAKSIAHATAQDVQDIIELCSVIKALADKKQINVGVKGSSSILDQKIMSDEGKN